jgi:hypothetical protein|tara:strand:+ start:1902 stop:2060 length:159 start_codon:yes stop_codon:yes gene_type:complete
VSKSASLKLLALIFATYVQSTETWLAMAELSPWPANITLLPVFGICFILSAT